MRFIRGLLPISRSHYQLFKSVICLHNFFRCSFQPTTIPLAPIPQSQYRTSTPAKSGVGISLLKTVTGDT